MTASLRRRVWQRANGICEYCRMPSQFYRSPYQIDHITAEQHGGKLTLANTALACFHWNLCKGPNLAGSPGRSLYRFRLRLYNPINSEKVLAHDQFRRPGWQVLNNPD